MATQTKPVTAPVTDAFPINGTDHIELYVGNAKQSSIYYRTAFGFRLVAYRGPETGTRDRASYVLEQDKVRLVLTTPLRAIWSRVTAVATKSRSIASARAALSDDMGEVVTAAIQTYGDTVHSLVERRNYRGAFMPGYVPIESRCDPPPVGLKYVDHCVGNVELGAMNRWVGFYETVMGFYNLISFDDKDISTEYSALMSKVVSSGNGRIKFPLNEPAQGKRKSQIDEYLEFYGGPGVQHIAIATDDIVGTVTALRDHGVEFLRVPTTYYDSVIARVGKIDEDLEPLRELGILVDRDDEGYLLQIFTKPVQDRPTLFYEIIQRKGAKSFGAGNFKALFEAIEREQALRGNL